MKRMDISPFITAIIGKKKIKKRKGKIIIKKVGKKYSVQQMLYINNKWVKGDYAFPTALKNANKTAKDFISFEPDYKFIIIRK